MLLLIFLLLVFLLLLLLLVPVDLEGLAVLGKRPKIRILWLFGLIGKELFQETAGGLEPSEEFQKIYSGKQPIDSSPKEAERKTEREKRIWSGRDILSIIQTEGLMGNLERLLRDLTYAVRIRYFRARLRIGLEDPADTGLAAGLLCSAIGYLGSFYPLDVKIEPSFCQEALEKEGQGALRIWPALVLLPLLRFSLSRPALRAARKILRIMNAEKQD